MSPAEDPLADFLDLDCPVPELVCHATISLDAPAPAGEVVAAPCWLWVRKADLVIHRGGRGEYRGTLKMLARANGKRASVARTAALAGEAHSPIDARSLLKLASLRTLGRLSKPLKPHCDNLSRQLLDALGDTSTNALWQSKTTHTLPAEPQDLKLLTDPESARRSLEIWLDNIATSFCAVRMVGRSSERRGVIRSGGYLALIEEFGGAERYDVPGTSEWQRLTDEELRDMTRRHSGEDLARRFGISRTSIARACVRRGIQPPRQRPGRKPGEKAAR